MGEANDAIADTRGPDGGRRGWIAVLTQWTRSVLGLGVLKGLGVMLPTLEQQLATQTWVVGWITSLIMAVGGFSGVGVKVPDVILKQVVALSFTDNYATANGISRTGYSATLLAYTPLVQLLLNTYGWRGTMLLIGAISMHLVVCGALMVTTTGKPDRRSVARYQNVPTDEIQSPNSTRREGGCGTLCKEVFAKFDVGLLLDSRFWAVTLINALAAYAFDMWIIYFVSQGIDNGFSTQEVGTFVIIAGVANLVAKVLQGLLTDRGIITSSILSAIFIITATASYCLTPWQTSYWPMLFLSCVAIFSDGVVCCQGDVLVKQAMGSESLVATFAWIEVTYAAIIFTFGFLPGWLYDTTGNFTTSFMFIGLVQGVTILPLIYLWFCGHVK